MCAYFFSQMEFMPFSLSKKICFSMCACVGSTKRADPWGAAYMIIQDQRRSLTWLSQ